MVGLSFSRYKTGISSLLSLLEFFIKNRNGSYVDVVLKQLVDELPFKHEKNLFSVLYYLKFSVFWGIG